MIRLTRTQTKLITEIINAVVENKGCDTTCISFVANGSAIEPAIGDDLTDDLQWVFNCLLNGGKTNFRGNDLECIVEILNTIVTNKGCCPDQEGFAEDGKTIFTANGDDLTDALDWVLDVLTKEDDTTPVYTGHKYHWNDPDIDEYDDPVAARKRVFEAIAYLGAKYWLLQEVDGTTEVEAPAWELEPVI